MLEDRWLIWKLRNGREDGLIRAYSKYKDTLLRVACALCRDTCQAEDVVQDIFVALAESAGRLRLDGNLRGYLMRCLVNRVKNLKTAKGSKPTVPLNEEMVVYDRRSNPEQWVVLDEQIQRACQALSQLPDEQRLVIGLYVYAGLKFRDIAELEQISINTVQSRYRYGLEKLRILLEGEVKP